MREQQRGLLIVAHGSDIAGSENELLHVAEMVRQELGCVVVECGFLRTNGATRTIAEATGVCAKRGVRELWVMPYFLTAGYLQKKAVHQAEQAAREVGLKLSVAPPLGLHPLLIDLVLLRVAEALSASSATESVTGSNCNRSIAQKCQIDVNRL